MRTHRVLPKLICLFCVCLLCSSSVFARDIQDSIWISGKKTIRVVHEQDVFDIVQSTRFFDNRCLTTLDCLSFPLGGSPLARSLSPKPDRRSIDEKVADTFMMMTAYPGGELLYNTVCAGLDLLLYSEEVASIRYENLTIGGSYDRTGRRFLNTGFFYNF
jgi:hypothetical protein